MKLTQGVSVIAVIFLLGFLDIASCDHSFDYYVFSQQWPSSVCIAANEKRISCDIPSKVKSWVIHGLWPSKHTHSPQFCNSSYHFNESEIKSLEDELEIHWPNLYTKTKETSFWKHEWEKHGTCSEDNPYILNEKSYFEMGIKLNKKYNLKKIYEESGLIAVNYTSYKCEDFRNVIRKNWGVESIITCIYSDQKHYVMQSELCIDKNFKLIDCKAEQFCELCPRNKNIWYLPFGSPIKSGSDV